MTRLSSDDIRNGRVYNGYDYRLQVWVINGIITDVGSGGDRAGQSIYDQPDAEIRGLNDIRPDPPVPQTPVDASTSSPYLALAANIGALVTTKQEQYGDSFGTAPKILQLLYPNGIQPNQYTDLLTIVRILDKFKRLATNHSTDTENPWHDITGYSLLALHAHLTTTSAAGSSVPSPSSI